MRGSDIISNSGRFPNHNGWEIRQTNLFEDGALDRKMRANNVIICNPPFQAFSEQDRKRYALARSAPSKAIAVLNAALDAHPIALGFVLPRAFILEKPFADQRRRLEKLYGTIELVERTG